MILQNAPAYVKAGLYPPISNIYSATSPLTMKLIFCSYDSSSSVMSPLFANESCDPFTTRESQCVLGTYVQYAVDVHSDKDLATTLAFAQQRNIRVVIRNTGHDYNGKSTGAGAIAIWTHHLKEITVLDHETSRYTGKAMKMGAGVQAFEAYEAAHKHNLVVVGGECPTVGLAGGYVSIPPLSDPDLNCTIDTRRMFISEEAQFLPMVGRLRVQRTSFCRRKQVQRALVLLSSNFRTLLTFLFLLQTQGGGHSALSSKYGLGADQVLEWDVVVADGRRLIASRDQNSDLFWALSGGGGGTYGVVLSMTVKVYPDGPTTGANLTFSNIGVSQNAYWEAIDTHYSTLPSVVDEGIMALSFITNETFTIGPMTGPGVTPERMNELLEPLTTKLEKEGITYTKVVKQFPTYYDHFNTMIPEITVGVALYGGRLISRSFIAENVTTTTDAFRNIIANGGGITIVGLNVSESISGDVYNSVNPIWRDTLLDTVVTIPYDLEAPLSDAKASANKLTEEFMPLLTDITPGRGTYLNEVCLQAFSYDCN